ncbi:MAG TPA: hypothetical protein VNT99_08385 [Methylomirabilota bacterium]|nr:hypothetical protein [Methylomirabilota bacterium]
MSALETNPQELMQRALLAAERLGATPVVLQLDLGTAMQIISALQLACRHPDFNGGARETVEGFARDAQESIGEQAPEIAEFLELGWSEEYDVPIVRGSRCRVCGCTNEMACPGGCHWVEENLCSACAPAAHSIILP